MRDHFESRAARQQRSRLVLLLPALQLLLALALTSAPVLMAAQTAAPSALVQEVGAVSIVVADIDRSVDFYSRVLTFQKVSDMEVTRSDVEHLEGLFSVRMRIARMRLGDEFLDYTEFLTPQGRPMPADSRANDRWFQHVAIIVNDMDRAYQLLRTHNVRHASTGLQRMGIADSCSPCPSRGAAHRHTAVRGKL
jgi:catechol 2,3-dioxygenase-like lactoylglutathione lyase family enzyme